MCFFNSAEPPNMEQTQPVYTLKNLSRRKFSFPKFIQFSQGNNVTFDGASMTDGFLSRETCSFHSGE
jgi:hypothetical protein